MGLARDPAPLAQARPERPPALSTGVELLGEYEGSGFKVPPSLVRRSDGQILQLPPLLYQVLKAIDGHRDRAQIAAIVSDEVQRGVASDDVAFLIEERLRPQRLVAAPDGTDAPALRPDPFLAFRYRIGVVSERVSGALGAAFMALFFPPVLVILVAGLIGADWWVFFDQGVAQALRQALYHPGLFLPLLAAVILSAAFHEIGHASACRYGGASPGRMGCGLYLAWPAFYTDVSDAYRLDRRGRLRTDLGGVYFNVVIILVTTGVFAATHNLEALLLLIVIEHMEIAHQLLPIVRLDGYYVVADLTGVPDLFARIGPILRGLLFWREPDQRVTELKRWVRVVISVWVLIVVPLLVGELLIVLIHLPRILGTSWDSASRLARAAGRAFSHANLIGGIADALQILVLAIPIAGILLSIQQLGRKGSAWIWRATRHRPLRRTLAMLAMGGFVALLLLAWIPSRNYRPIQPGERGTQGQGLHALFTVVGGAGPLYSERATLSGSRAQHGARQTNPSPAPTHAVPPSRPFGGAPPVPAAPAPGVPAPSLTPVTLPPATLPTVTLPPTTLPTVTLPPTTLPTVTLPPTTLPAVTLPPPVPH